ncbi:MAG: hypothetical protein ABIA37_04125, partial [Candidatus Woesearchaeota archaeon]
TLLSNDADGLNNKFTAGFGTNSILSRTSHGLLKLCAEDQWESYQSLELVYEENKKDLQTVSQVCEGLIGVNCKQDVTQAIAGSYKLPGDAKTGCWLIVTINKAANTFARAEAVEGQIIYEKSLGTQFESVGNIKVVDGTLYGSTDSKNALRENAWTSLPGKTLLCLNKYWYACRPGKVGDTLTVFDKRYNCTLENNIFTWRKI